MKVLLIAAGSTVFGGGERHVADLVRCLPEHGVEVALVCPPGDLGPTSLATVARDAGSVVYTAATDGVPTRSARQAIRRAIASFSPDIVHAHGSRAALHTRLADSRARQRCVVTVHGIHADKAPFMRRTALLSAERFLRPKTAAFITVCESDLRRGTRLGIVDPTRAVVIHNGIELPAAREQERFSEPWALGVRGAPADGAPPGPSQRPLALSIGRLTTPKDYPTLIRAWALVVQRMPEARLAIIGSGELQSSLELLTATLGLGESLTILPPRSDVRPAYRAADAFVLSSRWEGLPYVVLEAMSYSLPVVATRVDGIPEAARDGVEGLLVDPGNPEALAQALVSVLGDQALSRKLGQAGRARVARDFSLDAMVAATVSVYRAVAEDATLTAGSLMGVQSGLMGARETHKAPRRAGQ